MPLFLDFFLVSFFSSMGDDDTFYLREVESFLLRPSARPFGYNHTKGDDFGKIVGITLAAQTVSALVLVAHWNDFSVEEHGLRKQHRVWGPEFLKGFSPCPGQLRARWPANPLPHWASVDVVFAESDFAAPSGIDCGVFYVDPSTGGTCFAMAYMGGVHKSNILVFSVTTSTVLSHLCDCVSGDCDCACSQYGTDSFGACSWYKDRSTRLVLTCADCYLPAPASARIPSMMSASKTHMAVHCRVKDVPSVFVVDLGTQEVLWCCPAFPCTFLMDGLLLVEYAEDSPFVLHRDVRSGRILHAINLGCSSKDCPLSRRVSTRRSLLKFVEVDRGQVLIGVSIGSSLLDAAAVKRVVVDLTPWAEPVRGPPGISDGVVDEDVDLDFAARHVEFYRTQATRRGRGCGDCPCFPLPRGCECRSFCEGWLHANDHMLRLRLETLRPTFNALWDSDHEDDPTWPMVDVVWVSVNDFRSRLDVVSADAHPVRVMRLSKGLAFVSLHLDYFTEQYLRGFGFFDHNTVCVKAFLSVNLLRQLVISPARVAWMLACVRSCFMRKNVT
jgi:hypothetical protein